MTQATREKDQGDTFVVECKDLRKNVIDALVDFRDGIVDINQAADAIEKAFESEQTRVARRFSRRPSPQLGCQQ